MYPGRSNDPRTDLPLKMKKSAYLYGCDRAWRFIENRKNRKKSEKFLGRGRRIYHEHARKLAFRTTRTEEEKEDFFTTNHSNHSNLLSEISFLNPKKYFIALRVFLGLRLRPRSAGSYGSYGSWLISSSSVRGVRMVRG